MSSPEFQKNRDNFCYRHKDRVSFVLCQRCLRTICGECQIQGSVGVICPNCLKDQQKGRSPAQKKAERRWGSRQPVAAIRSGQPVATFAIILVTFAVYVLQWLVGTPITNALAYYTPLVDPRFVEVPQLWRPLTVLFVHSGFIHVALNMLALWMIGRVLEPLLGRARFVALYFIAGIGGSALVALVDPTMSVVGASGAVFGLMGALLVISRRLGADISGILVVLGINLVIGFVPGFHIAWQAHIGGLIAGALAGLVFMFTRRREQRVMQILGLAAVTVLVIALLAVGVMTATYV